MIGLAILLTICFTTSSTFADTLTERSVLPNYAVVSLGPTASLAVGRPIAGPILIGAGSSNSGLSNACLNASGTCIRTPITVSGTTSPAVSPTLNVTTDASGAIAETAAINAVALSDAAADLPNTLGITTTCTPAPCAPGTTINGAKTFVGNGGLNVINVTNWTNAGVTSLVGGPNDIFVFNLTSMTGLSNSPSWNLGCGPTPQGLNPPPACPTGVQPSHILFNLLGGPGTNVYQATGGTCTPRFGTFLAVNGGNFTGSGTSGCFEGQVIDLGGSLFTSGSTNLLVVSSEPFEGVIPEPSSLILLGTGLMGLVGATRRKLLL